MLTKHLISEAIEHYLDDTFFEKQCCRDVAKRLCRRFVELEFYKAFANERSKRGIYREVEFSHWQECLAKEQSERFHDIAKRGMTAAIATTAYIKGAIEKEGVTKNESRRKIRIKPIIYGTTALLSTAGIFGAVFWETLLQSGLDVYLMEISRAWFRR